jgi:hypothetical protein
LGNSFRIHDLYARVNSFWKLVFSSFLFKFFGGWDMGLGFVCLLLLLMINESIKVSPFSLIYVFCVCIMSVLAAALNLESLRV